MGKVSPSKRFKIRSFFSGMKPHIDSVKYSLEHLVFASEKEMEQRIIKKRWRVAISTAMLLLTVSIFISPLGTADSVVFYPHTCLGGWLNPKHAEGEPDVKSSTDAKDFNVNNSAVLPKDTQAEMYCGNFSGDFKSNTKPTKMLVTLSISVGEEVLLQDNITGSSFASSSGEILDIASTTDVSFTLATSTATSSEATTAVEANASSTQGETGTTTQPQSVLDKVLDAVQSIIAPSDTAPVIPSEPQVPQPTNETSPQNGGEQPPSQPTSFLEQIFNTLSARLVTRVFAQEASTNTSTTSQGVGDSPVPVVTAPVEQSVDTTPTNETTSTTPIIPTNITTESVTISSTTEGLTPLVEISTASSSQGGEHGTSTDDVATTTQDTATTTQDMATSTPPESLVEVLYTFDGVAWYTLGELDKESMKYRTFEISVSATTTWDDMGRLQIKVIPKKHIDAIPTIYLDGIHVEVLYETIIDHTHPDFTRDTILDDRTVGDLRIVRIINNDNDKEEVWYMHVETATTTVASSTDDTASSTNATSTESVSGQKEDIATTTEEIVMNLATTTATTTPSVPKIKKNTWYQLDKILTKESTLEEILIAIKEQEKRKQTIPPNFNRDTIKAIRGVLGDIIIVQLVQDGVDSLWLFDMKAGVQKKIDEDGNTTIAKEYPFGVKDRNIFWLSEGRDIVYTYNIDSGLMEYREIPPYDKDNGGRGEVEFGSTPWKVIVGADNFSFYSEITGEVFSDDNLTTVEAFRIKEELDTLVGKERLEELNFVIDEAVE